MKSFHRVKISQPLQLAAFALALLSPALLADVIPSPLFTDNAVLQRDAEVPVWGTADAGESVTVSFGGQTREVTADDQGHWLVQLRPIQANVTDTLVIRGKNRIALTNIVMGDVWLCSGQSNMGLRVREVMNAPVEIAAANEPEIRQLLVPNKPSPEPQPDTFIKTAWQPASPQTVADFTAAGYFFGRELHRTLGVPIGLINSSWGGTPIQPWISIDLLKDYSGYEKLLERKEAEMAAWPAREKQLEAALKAWEAESAAAQAAGKPAPVKPWNPGPPNSGQYMPAQLYNGMIHPLLRYRIKGAIWYQGESNAGSGAAGAADYTDLQSRMVEGWRRDFGIGDFPFYFVQLPNYGNSGDASGKSWAFFREGQANALHIPNSGMAVTIDIGDSNNIHPKNKQEAGRRLALVALAGTYGRKLVASGPVRSAVSIQGDAIRVRFDHAESGLAIHGDGPLSGFEIAGVDAKFVPAQARIDRDTVVVSNTLVREPAFIRYAWANDPSVNLFNGVGLPAVPFRTDTLSR